MTTITQLEDLSSEIFLEILEYLDGDEMAFTFASFNSRISLLLSSIPLHINIYRTYCRREFELLSNYLKFHFNQVVSLQSYDQICDQTNVIAYLFHLHNFLNLRSCIFHSDYSR
ncbi:unnamed protein product, partial [Rotaria magnacalcarata]